MEVWVGKAMTVTSSPHMPKQISKIKIGIRSINIFFNTDPIHGAEIHEWVPSQIG